MWQETEEWTGDEAYENMKWCQAAVKQLRELPEEKARAWWDKQEKPNWLDLGPEQEQSLESFADRLEQDEYEWAETASIRYAEEKDAEEKEKARALGNFEWSINRRRERLEHIRLCREIPEANRAIKGSQLAYNCGYLYLMKEFVAVRKPHSQGYEETPKSTHKIGATRRPFRKRSNELWRDKGLLSKASYVTLVPFELEKALHLHFDQYRLKRAERQKGQRKNTAGEYFRLPEQDIATFKETVATIEKWVLLSVEAKLELEILRVEAVLLRARKQQG
jgi:hypothetical protein